MHTYREAVTPMVKKFTKRWAAVSAACLFAVNGVQGLVAKQANAGHMVGPQRGLEQWGMQVN